MTMSPDHMAARLSIESEESPGPEVAVNPFGEGDPSAVSEPIPDPDPDDIPGRLRRLLWLKTHIDSLEAQLKAAQKEYLTLGKDTVREMAVEGMTSTTINGWTGFFASKRHVERKPGVQTDQVIEAMRAAGLGHMVKPNYNGNTLKSYLTELQRDNIPVPAALAEVVELVTDYEIRFTRAAASKRNAPDPASLVRES